MCLVLIAAGPEGDVITQLRYNEGQAYDVHFEFYSNPTDDQRKGGKAASILLFLSDTELGGEVVFPFAQVRPVDAKCMPNESANVSHWHCRLMPNVPAHELPDESINVSHWHCRCVSLTSTCNVGKVGEPFATLFNSFEMGQVAEPCGALSWGLTLAHAETLRLPETPQPQTKVGEHERERGPHP